MVTVAPLTNITAPVYDDATTGVVTVTQHAISLPEIIAITSIFVFLSYWYNKVTLNKEQYTEWTNPNGRVINLYKKVRWGFWIYVVTISVLAILQIILTP